MASVLTVAGRPSPGEHAPRRQNDHNGNPGVGAPTRGSLERPLESSSSNAGLRQAASRATPPGSRLTPPGPRARPCGSVQRKTRDAYTYPTTLSTASTGQGSHRVPPVTTTVYYVTRRQPYQRANRRARGPRPQLHLRPPWAQSPRIPPPVTDPNQRRGHQQRPVNYPNGPCNKHSTRVAADPDRRGWLNYPTHSIMTQAQSAWSQIVDPAPRVRPKVRKYYDNNEERPG